MPSRFAPLRSLPPAAALLAALALSACSQLRLGTCSTNADCKAGSTCDTTQSPPLCVVPAGSCFPACANGETCRAGSCVAPGCSPACTATQLCDLDAGTCENVTAPSVTLTSPAANSFVGATLAATADAVAPGGITALRFELTRGTTAIAQGAAVATPTAGDPANWAGSIDLTSLPSGSDGVAQLIAIATISGGDTQESAPIDVTVDETPPAIAMGTDGRAQLYAGGATVQIVAQITDSGAGFSAGAQAKLAFTGVTHAPVLAPIAGPAGSATATFSVLLDDVLAPAGVSSTIPFSITAMDAVGNSATLAADPKEVIRVDREAPVVTLDAPPSWHSQVERVAVTGTLSEPGGSLAGGSTGVVLSHGGSALATATVTLAAGSTTSATWTASVDLSAQTFPSGFEGSWTLSAAATDAVGNPAAAASGSLLVDDAPPQISDVNVVSPPSYDAGAGVYGPGGDLLITAQIADPSGVASAQLAFQDQSGVAGTSADGGSWSFAVPRPSGSFDGTLVPFTIYAGDAFADAGLSPAAAAVHEASASEPGLLFDDTPPSISIATDSRWYIRAYPDGGASLVEVDAVIGDGTGVATSGPYAPTLTPSGGAALQAARSDGGTFSFLVNPALSISAGDAGPLAFTVRAQDLVGNAGSASGSLNIDGADPALSGVQVYRTSDGAPAAGTAIGYPPNQANTGHDSKHFIYNDALTIAGTIVERGAGLQAVTLQINGQQLDGGASPGQPIPLDCAQGANSCTFKQSFALNAAGSGSFTTPIVDGGLPTGTLTVALLATDLSDYPDGGAASQSGSSSLAVGVTRHLWHEQLIHLANTTNSTTAGVVGFALHPDGDLIVTGTTDGTAGASSVFALPTSGPFADGGVDLDWSWGGNSGKSGGSVGNASDAPAIGAGDANGALIYVASGNGYLSALEPDGGTAWQLSPSNTSFKATPTVVQTSVTIAGASVQVEEAIAPADSTNGKPMLYGVYSAPGATPYVSNSAPLGASGSSSNPLSLGGTLYMGTSDGVFSTYTLSDGDFADAGSEPTDAGGFWEPITDGSSVFVAFASSNATATPIYQFAPADLLGAHLAGTFNGVIANPTLDPSGLLYVSTGDDLFDSLDPTSGTVATLRSLPASGKTALAGSDGHVYLPYLEGYLLAFAGGQPSWSFSRDKAISPMAAIDCQGVLYVGSGATVYAFVTDDHGLADSGWPNHRRDGRASGNANSPLYGIRTASGCTQ